jgi:maltose alpha-D-glucosyltransferase / alpha-amylase
VLGDAVLLCEANVPADDLPKYCGASSEGPNDRAHMLFAFLLNTRLWLGLAREDSEVIVEALSGQPKLPAMAQWATFLRNHDELDLSQLTAEQRDDVFKAFAPADEMRIYGRGIRRRLAPMLKGNRRRMELAYALQFAVPGTPVLRYGEEIGMGEDLHLPGRHAIRTPMQWNDGPAGGFSTSEGLGLAETVSVRGRYGARRVSVQAQIGDPVSLLRWFQQLIATLRECPEIGNGHCTVVDAALPRPVLAHRMDAPDGSILLLHNLGPEAHTIDIGKLEGMSGRPFDVLADAPYPRPTKRLTNLELHAWGYRWIRLRRST